MKKFKVTVDGQSYVVSVEEIAGESLPADASRNAGAIPAQRPRPEQAAAPPIETKQATAPPQAQDSAAPGDGHTVPSPMPGSIIDINVKVGDAVKEGDILLILEAMKMENEITSPVTGTIAQVLVSKGAAVNSGDPLIVIA